MKDKKKPVLFIYYGHGSHLFYIIVKQAMGNGITLLCFPQIRSHELQQLDVGVFSKMKKAWKEFLKNWFGASRMLNVTEA